MDVTWFSDFVMNCVIIVQVLTNAKLNPVYTKARLELHIEIIIEIEKKLQIILISKISCSVAHYADYNNRHLVLQFYIRNSSITMATH